MEFLISNLSIRGYAQNDLNTHCSPTSTHCSVTSVQKQNAIFNFKLKHKRICLKTIEIYSVNLQ